MDPKPLGIVLLYPEIQKAFRRAFGALGQCWAGSAMISN